MPCMAHSTRSRRTSRPDGARTHTCTRGGPAYRPGTSASCAWPIARRRRPSSLRQSKMTFWEWTALTASSGTRNSPAFSTYTTRPSGDTSRTAPNSSFPSATKVWYPTSIVSRMIGSPGSRDRPPSLLHEPRVQVNLRSGQRLRHGTVLLGVQRIPLKCRVVDARNLGLGLQLDPGDGEPFADLLQGDFRAGLDARRREARPRKLSGQCHREAPGVSSAD